MKLITSATLDALFIGFSKKFDQAYMGVPNELVNKIGSVVPSTTRDQRYPFMQAIKGAMRKWTGERVINNAVVTGFTVTNAKYEDSLAIAREDIEDDQYGVYSSMLIPQLARHAKILPDTEIASLINSNLTCFDGKAMFATDHPTNPFDGSGAAQSNSLTGKPLNATNLAIAQATLRGFKGPDGIPLGSAGSVLLVPPSLEMNANVLANSAFYPDVKNGSSNAVFGSMENPWKGAFQVVVSELLTDSGDPATAVWYLLDCRDANLRPFFWQERVVPQLTALTDPGNSKVFMEDQFYMGVRARGAAAPGLWFKAVKVSGA